MKSVRPVDQKYRKTGINYSNFTPPTSEVDLAGKGMIPYIATRIVRSVCRWMHQQPTHSWPHFVIYFPILIRLPFGIWIRMES